VTDCQLLTAATSGAALHALHVGARALESLVSLGQLCLESSPCFRAVLGGELSACLGVVAVRRGAN
jgi:hypothetical protein